MTDKRWKAFERRVARAFGCERTPLSGGNSKHTRADVLHPTLYIECKSNVRYPLLKVVRGKTRGLVSCGPLWLLLWHSSYHGPTWPLVDPVSRERKADALATLYQRVSELARLEHKTAVLCIGQKGRHGFWLCCLAMDAEQVCAAM